MQNTLTIEQRYTVAVNHYLYACNIARDFALAFEYRALVIHLEQELSGNAAQCAPVCSVWLRVKALPRRLYYGARARFASNRLTR